MAACSFTVMVNNVNHRAHAGVTLPHVGLNHAVEGATGVL